MAARAVHAPGSPVSPVVVCRRPLAILPDCHTATGRQLGNLSRLALLEATARIIPGERQAERTG